MTRWVALVLLLQGSALAQRVAAQQTPPTTSNKTKADFSELEKSLAPKNPFMAEGGAAAEHNDSYSSDVTTLSGPGGGAVNISVTKSEAICPTLVLDKQGYVLGYCIDLKAKHSYLRLLAPDTLETRASLDMPASGRLGGFYMYVDEQDRIVVGAGDNHLLRITHEQDSSQHWKMNVVNNWDLSKAVTGHCGASDCDYLESVMPDWAGRIWFSSEGGVMGTVDPESGAVHSVTLPEGEIVANSISTSPDGVAVPSDHALYLFGAQADGTPLILWREVYDRGTKTKPGRLSQGTGSTPVFFGREGHPYVAITDNGDAQERLRVYRVKAMEGKRLVCTVPLFAPGTSADENAPIGVGDSLILSNTYGYDYADYMGKDVKPLPGGLTRVDVRLDAKDCNIVWTNPVPSAAVPKLSIRDGLIYTVKRTVADSKPQYSFVAIDFTTGRTVGEKSAGEDYALDPFQLAGTIGPHGVLYQPAIGAIVQVRPEEAAPKSKPAN